MPRYKENNRNQMILLPTTIEQLVDENHLAKKIWKILNHIDLSKFNINYNNDESGQKAYKPINLLAILIYSYISGVHSSRVIEKKCKEDLAYMYLGEMITPDHSTIAYFRTKHKQALEDVFSQTIYLGLETELIDLKHIATDGTKINGMGSANQIIEGSKVQKQIQKCEKYAKKLVEQAEQTDIDETTKRKLEKKCNEIENKLSRLEKIKRQYDEVKDKSKKKLYHQTEEDSRLMRDKDGYHNGYNCQTSVDSKYQMIIDNRVSQDASDSHNGAIARERLLERFGELKLRGSTMSFDNGYSSAELIELDGKNGIKLLVSQYAESKQISGLMKKIPDFVYDAEKDVFICPSGQELKYKRDRIFSGKNYKEYGKTGCTNCIHNEQCFKPSAKNKRMKSKLVKEPKASNQLMLHRKKMTQPENISEYRKRLSTVEPVYAHISVHRKFDRFNVWNLKKVCVEFSLVCIVHNLLKLISYGNLV